MSWPPFRCVVDSHPPAVSVCRFARGRPHLRRTPVSFRPASRISTKHAGRRRGKRVSAVSSVFPSLQEEEGDRRGDPRPPCGHLGHLALAGQTCWRSSSTRIDSTSNTGIPELHATTMDGGTACRGGNGHCHDRNWRTAASELAVFPLAPAAAVGPSLHEIGLSSTQRERGRKRKPSDNVQTPLQPDIGQGL